MAIVDIWATPIATETGGTIVGRTASVTHNFLTPSLILAYGCLQHFSPVDDDASAVVKVTKCVDVLGVHYSDHMKLKRKNCTSVTYNLVVAGAASATAVCIAQILG
ncbi:MAG: hypothetical protein WCE79_12235 [Xanthobacteraceae bacterium]